MGNRKLRGWFEVREGFWNRIGKPTQILWSLVQGKWNESSLQTAWLTWGMFQDYKAWILDHGEGRPSVGPGMTHARFKERTTTTRKS